MKKINFIFSLALGLLTQDTLAAENILFHETSSVTIKTTRNGGSVALSEVLSPRSPLRAKGDSWNCQDEHGLRKKSGTVFLGSPDITILPLTYTFDFDYWTINCHTEGGVFYVTLQEPSPENLRKSGYSVNEYYEHIHNLNPEKVIRLPELPQLLGKAAVGKYECRLYNNKFDNSGVFFGCTTLSTKSENDPLAESKLEIQINVIDNAKPVNVAKRFPKMNAGQDGKIQSVTLFGSRTESNGIAEPTVKPVTIPYSDYLRRALTIDNEEYILTD